MYCGNNLRNPKVRSGQQVVGTRYGCLKRGIGVGLGLPYDPEYSNRYVPVDARKIYCGEFENLPDGYDLMGSNSMCYLKGVGVGKALKAKKIRSGKHKKITSRKPKKIKSSKPKKITSSKAGKKS